MSKTCCPCDSAGSAGTPIAGDPLAWFEKMLEHCLEHAVAAKSAGKRVVGILCEFTPRELIMAAGGVPVCLCGGSAKTIPAAEEYLPANLCPLIKSTFGYHVLKTNPFLEMADLVVGETTCDGRKRCTSSWRRRDRSTCWNCRRRPTTPRRWTIGMPNWRSFATSSKIVSRSPSPMPGSARRSR